MSKTTCYEYRCEATSLEGFIQQIAVAYVVNGKYFFYVTGVVPKRLSWQEHDKRMIKKYGCAMSPWSRCRRRKKPGPNGVRFANCHYIRFRNFWVLLCQEGHHQFFNLHCSRDEYGKQVKRQFRDVREESLRFGGYSIGYSRGRLNVRLSKNARAELREMFMQQALLPREHIEWEFRNFPFVAWGGVIRQCFAILKAVNGKRKAAGLCEVSEKCVVRRRVSIKPFEKTEAMLALEPIVAAQHDYAVAA